MKWSGGARHQSDMASRHNEQRRRSRLDEDEESNEDQSDNALRSTPPSSKRPRTSANTHEGIPELGSNGYQPGALVRVKLENFVTYERAEFFPGPSLNMVIGPNGTGKSSLVCAICLGLGWGPQHLGRATQLGEFVKHGMSEAVVEIELQGFNMGQNSVVKLKIIRDGNAREWWIDGKRTSLKAVQMLMRKFSVQIDNLCQFLPQDKVSEFAALSPEDLLEQTQRAAAPEEMLQQHEELKVLRDDQQRLDLSRSQDQSRLVNLESRQTNLRAEVQQLEERKQVENQVKFLNNCLPFAEYKVKHAAFGELKEAKKVAQRRLKELEEQVAPSFDAVKQKKVYCDKISAVVRDRKQRLHAAETEADDARKAFEHIDDEIKTHQNQVNEERTIAHKRKGEISVLDKEIQALNAKIEDQPEPFDATSFNNAIVSCPACIQGTSTQAS